MEHFTNNPIFWSILILVFVEVLAHTEEPLCTKFHYEEQTLEKMIRQELKVEKMHSSIEETQKLVETALVDLRNERQMFQAEMKELKAAQLLEKQQLEREKQNIRARLLSPTVAFQANTLKNARPTAGETFVFTNTVINEGNGYNNQTGMFTAPYKGLYSFSLHLCLEDLDSYVYYQITSSVRSFLIGYFVNPNGSYYACFSVQALAALEREEVVFVKMVSTSVSGKDVIWESEGSVINQFAGVLLQTDN